MKSFIFCRSILEWKVPFEQAFRSVQEARQPQWTPLSGKAHDLELGIALSIFLVCVSEN